MPRKKDLFEHEWHLYSTISIISVLTFLVIQIASDTDKEIGIAFSALVGSFFFASDNWKNAASEIHKWVVAFSFLIIIFGSGVIYWLNGKED